MPVLSWPAAMGGWEIDSTNMCGPGWKPLNLETLWEPAPNRGEDRIIPGASGALAKPRRPTSRTVDVFLQIAGSQNQAGTPYSDETEGLAANLATIAALVGPPTLPTVTRTSTLTMPDATELTAAVHVEQIQTSQEGPNILRAVLTITIPAGAHS